MTHFVAGDVVYVPDQDPTAEHPYVVIRASFLYTDAQGRGETIVEARRVEARRLRGHAESIWRPAKRLALSVTHKPKFVITSLSTSSYAKTDGRVLAAVYNAGDQALRDAAVRAAAVALGYEEA